MGNTRGWGKMSWFHLLVIPVRDVHWMSASVKPEAAHSPARARRSSDSLYTILFCSFKQKPLWSFITVTKTSLQNCSSYLFCVFFLQGGTSSYLGSDSNKQSKSSQIDTCKTKESEVQFCLLSLLPVNPYQCTQPDCSLCFIPSCTSTQTIATLPIVFG